MGHKENAKTKAHGANGSAATPTTNEADPNAHLTTPTRLTGSEILWATLVGKASTPVFGYPGGAILPAYDALRKFPIRHVLVRHEQGAAHMAEAMRAPRARLAWRSQPADRAATISLQALATACSIDSLVCMHGQTCRARCWVQMHFRKWILPASHRSDEHTTFS